MQADFDRFMTGLEIAGSRIDAHYFQIRVSGAEDSIYRERVYCYELYHQLRVALGDIFEYKLDGELDKKNHAILVRLGARKPDLVVHVPGNMDGNLVVIEVKKVETRKQLLENDLCKLMKFLDDGNYFRGIMLVYGDGYQKLPDWIRDKVLQLQESRLALVWHAGPGESPRIING